MLVLATSQGLSSGNDPVLGGVICWDEAGGGHCQVIESIVGPDEVIVSESGWNYTTAPVVKTQHTYRVGGVWVYQAGYTYQGIFYPPRPVMSEELAAFLFGSRRRREETPPWI